MCKPEPHHHKRSYSLGHRGSNASDEWSLLSPISGILPSLLLFLHPFPAVRGVHTVGSWAHVRHTDTMSDLLLSAAKGSTDRWAWLIFLEVTSLYPPPWDPKELNISHIPVSLLNVGELTHVFWGESSPLNSSIICKPALPKELSLVMKPGQNQDSSSPRSHN